MRGARPGPLVATTRMTDMSEDIYVVEGLADDPHYGTILLYHGKVRGGAVNPYHWSGDYSDGINLHLYRDGEYYNVEIRDAPGDRFLKCEKVDKIRKIVGAFFDDPQKFWKEHGS